MCPQKLKRHEIFKIKYQPDQKCENTINIFILVLNIDYAVSYTSKMILIHFCRWVAPSIYLICTPTFSEKGAGYFLTAFSNRYCCEALLLEFTSNIFFLNLTLHRVDFP